MKMLDDWHWIVRHAWSFRLNIMAGVLAAAEIVLPLFVDDMPHGMFAGLTLITVVASSIARVVAQRHE
jgi:hypothetical protein